MWVMVAGPYTSGPATPEQNLAVLNQAALSLLRRGHIPVIGVNMALPMIATAGPGGFEEVMMPLSLALAERCDACLRVGGPSTGADAEVARFVARGRPVYRALEEVPAA